MKPNTHPRCTAGGTTAVGEHVRGTSACKLVVTLCSGASIRVDVTSFTAVKNQKCVLRIRRGMILYPLLRPVIIYLGFQYFDSKHLHTHLLI